MNHIDSGTSFCKITGHKKEVSSCAFNDRFFVTCSGDKSIRVFSAIDFTEKSYSPLLAHKYAVNCVTFDVTGRLMASASTDGTANIWSLSEDSALILTVFHHSDSNTVQVCSFSPNSAMLVTGSSDGGIGVWNIEQKKKLFQIIGHPEGNVNGAAFTPCNDYLVTGSAVGDIRVWDLRYNEFVSDEYPYIYPKCILQTQAHDKGVSGCGVDCIVFSPTFHIIDDGQIADSYLMATCGQDNQVKLWLFQRSIASTAAVKKDHSSKCLQPLHELSGHHGPVSQCCFSPDGLKLASSSFDKTVIIWNPVTGEQLLVLDGHSAIATCVAFSSDGKFLASTSYDKTTIVWRLTTDDKNDGAVSLASPGQSSGNLINLSTDQQQPSTSGVTPTAPVAVTKKIHEWTTSDVVEWLDKELKLTQYSKAFSENEIDGDELINLTTDVLSQDLGVAPLGHRNKILRGIKTLQTKDTSTSSTTFVQPNPVVQNGNPVFLQATTAPIFTTPAVTPSVRASPKLNIDDSSIPDEYLCPISREVMLDPVLAPDGFSYERTEIENWFRRGSVTSPMTNKKLTSRNLVPNQALRTIIMQFLESHKKT
uniref:WD repeat, SAM and U-box domain-containing protein 1-like isoform X1 n=1 Tax=Styela clava TaxID=7725 RepID=UPI00193940A1|nr:WD repeat, SAM and U-box domain-containing protein 1-like isoform X1 [Styela clava]